MTTVRSLPMRERGLKYFCFALASERPRVAPHAGAWIEMLLFSCVLMVCMVAPHAGAWIEIS